MSISPPLTAPPTTDRTELAELLVRTLRVSEEPQSLTQILNSVPRAVRPGADDAEQSIQELVRIGSLFQHPVFRKQTRYWHSSQTELAKQIILRRAESGAKTQSELLKGLLTLGSLRGLTKAALVEMVESLVSTKQLHKIPPHFGTKQKAAQFSITPPDLAQYVQSAMQWLATSLNVNEQELFSSYVASLQPHMRETSADMVEPIRDERIIEAMLDIDARANTGAMISIAELRKKLELPFKADDFDQALLKMSAAGILALHLFDRPQLVSDSDRAMLLRDKQGNYYNTVSLREE